MEIKIDQILIDFKAVATASSSEVEVVHTKHVFTAHFTIMAARAMPMAGGTSRLATDEAPSLCSRLHIKKKKRSDNVLEHWCWRHRWPLDEQPRLAAAKALGGRLPLLCAELSDGGGQDVAIGRGSVTRVVD